MFTALASTLFLLIYSSLLHPAQVANESVVTGALVHDYRGIELGAKGHLLTAKQEFIKALKYQPWFGRSLLNLQICNDVSDGTIDKKFAVLLFHALNYLSTVDSLETLRFTDDLLKTNEAYAPGYLLRAQIYLRLHRAEEALADYNAAGHLSPKDKLTYYFRGKLYARRQRYDLAINDFTKVITLAPSYAQAYLERGDAYTAQGKYNEAVADYEVALQAWPKWGKRFKVFAAYLNRGIANIRMGKNRDALADLTKAISLNPKITEAYFNRGVPWQKQRDFDEAVKDYLKVVKLDSNHVKAYFRFGEV